MKHSVTTLFLLAFVAMFVPYQSQAQDDATMAMMMPGPEHKLLERFAGDWDVEVRMWFPGMDMQESKTTEHSKVIFGGRFVHVTSTMDWMGTEVETIEYMGFNKATKKYEFFRIESMGTSMTKTEGEYNKADDSFTFHGKDTMPGPDGKMHEFSYDLIWKFDGDNKYQFTLMWPDETGKLTKMVETTATKK